MSPRAIPRVKRVIRAFKTGQARELWERALVCRDAGRIRAMLVEAMETAGLGGLVRAGN